MLFPVLQAVKKKKHLDYTLVISGSHLIRKYGSTIEEVNQDDHKNIIKVTSNNNFSEPGNMAVSISKIILKLTKVIQKIKPMAIVVYGDRYETFGATIAGHENNLVVAHIEGGDITSGGTHDDNIRHAITKLAHLHFPTNSLSYKKILSLGEEKWRVNMVGFTAIDLIKNNNFTAVNEVVNKYNIKRKTPVVLFTLHPLSTSISKTKKETDNAISALNRVIRTFNARCIVTYPNNDTGSRYIIEKINLLFKKNSTVTIHKSLGRKNYWGLLNLARSGYKVICVGNSSSGIKETTAFSCPTVNIGDRQKGRLAASNISNAKADKKIIFNQISRFITNDKIYNMAKKCNNPYGIGDAGKKIASILEKIELNEKYLVKKNI